MCNMQLLLFMALFMRISLASVVSNQKLSLAFNWTANGTILESSASFDACDIISINVADLDGSAITTNDLFMLSQTVAGLTDLRKLNLTTDGSFTYQIAPDEGQAMVTLLNTQGDSGQSVRINIGGESPDNCHVSIPTTDVVLTSNGSSDQTVDFCGDAVSFHISGGRQPYSAIVTSFSSENSTISNVTLGENDDMLFLPNNFRFNETTSVLVSVLDRDGVWSNSSELLSFGSQPGAPDCNLSVTSDTSNNISFSPSQPSGPSASFNPSTPPIPSSPIGPQRSKRMLLVTIIVPVFVGVSVLVTTFVLLRKKLRKRNDDRGFLIILSDMCSRPNAKRFKSRSPESDSTSDMTVRSYSAKQMEEGDKRSSASSSEQDGVLPSLRKERRVNSDIVPEYPVSHQRRPMSSFEPSSSEEARMEASVPDRVEKQPESAEAQDPYAQLQSLLALLDEDPGVEDAVGPNTHTQPSQGEGKRTIA